jgi:tRNA A-37 threonylcarbamoyl transferase component Bud32
MKASIVVPLALFVLYILIHVVQTPSSVEGPEITFSTYPIVSIFLWLSVLSFPFGGFFLIHSFWKDKQELAKDFSDVNQRHWITIIIFSYFSSGIYLLWYSYSRYRLTKNEAVDNIDTSESLTSNNDETSHSQKSIDESSEAENRAGPINDTLDGADSLRKNAREARDIGNYDRALEYYDETQEAYKNALEVSQDHNKIDTDMINHRLTTVQSERGEVHHQQLQDEVERLYSDFAEANTISESKPEEAKERLVDLESNLSVAKETAVQHDYDKQYDKIATLENRREERLREIIEQLKTHPIPDNISRAPDLSVEYDALTNKQPIGGGGNADVSKATLPTAGGNVLLAIKKPRMSGTIHNDQVERILQEAEIWDKLDGHDHIVGVVDYGSRPLPWIAMEYMDGGHLGDWSGEMDIPHALWTSLAVTRGVRYAHQRGIAHLDLKPENILFRTSEDAWDVPKVADWGLSKHLLEHSKSVEGLSPQYAAPEQFTDEYGPADDITDIYQLGTVFYELFTGRPPFKGKPAKTMHQVLNEQPTPPSEIADVPKQLDEILLTALAKEKDDRYDHIILLRNDLQELFDEW